VKAHVLGIILSTVCSCQETYLPALSECTEIRSKHIKHSPVIVIISIPLTLILAVVVAPTSLGAQGEPTLGPSSLDPPSLPIFSLKQIRWRAEKLDTGISPISQRFRRTDQEVR
jgi:hypothetical protein